jgi:hypothetical protein
MNFRKAKANVPGLRQETQFTCCATAIAACLQAHGKDQTEADVNRVLGASPMAGASWESILATVQYFGLRGSLVVPATVTMLKQWTDAGTPVIIGWNPEGRPWSHASVVVDVTDGPDGRYVHVMDSNIPNPDRTFRVVHEDEFCAKWGEKISDSLIMRRPACAVEREVTASGRQVRASGKYAAATGPYAESVIDGVRVVQVDVDGRSKAQLQGNKLLIKWGPDAPVGSSIRVRYLPKWVAWAKKHLEKKSDRIETKKEWSRTTVDGFSVYDLEGKEQVAAILAKIRRDVQPVLKEFGLSFSTLNESVAEGSLGFNRGQRIIALNVRQKSNPMLLRKYSAIMATMLHELAHLRHMNHGPQFKMFEAELVAWARSHGIYSPG